MMSTDTLIPYDCPIALSCEKAFVRPTLNAGVSVSSLQLVGAVRYSTKCAVCCVIGKPLAGGERPMLRLGG
jgi:hypothetical protein